MDSKLVEEFDYMCEDTVCTHVRVYTDHINVEDFVDDVIIRAFGEWGDKATLKDLDDFLESRCFPRTRANAKQLLNDMGSITGYDPWAIVRRTHGVMVDDFSWIRFKGETIVWEDINPRIHQPEALQIIED